MRTFKYIFALVLLCTSLLSWAADSTERADQRGAPIAQYLDADGHLNIPSGYVGSLDPAGYRMTTEANQAPRFVAAKGTEQPQSGGWTAFGGSSNGCNGTIYAVVTQSNGNIVVGGSFSVCVDTLANNIAVYTPSTNTWASLGTGSGNGVDSEVYALAVSGSDLYVGGRFSQAGDVSANRVARWNGSSWTSLGSGSSNGVGSSVFALAVSGNDLYVGGQFTQAGGLPANRVAHWNGGTWASLGGAEGGNGVNGEVRALAVSGSDLYVGGGFSQVGGLPANSIARWNGSSWASLGTGSSNGVNSYVRALAVSGSDLYVGGDFVQAGGLAASGVARWNGTSWASLGTGSSNGVNISVRALAVSGSDLYVGGYSIPRAGGLSVNNIARWNGSSWASLSVGSSNELNSFVFALAVSGSDLYVGGDFIQAGGVPANNVARWNGSSWVSLGTGSGNGGNGVSGNVNALTVSGSDLYVGGSFSQATGVPANNVACWNGSSWASLSTGSGNGVNNVVDALAVSGSDLYVGGSFTQAGGIPANYIARWNGSSWASLGAESGNGVRGGVIALAVSGSDLYVGGLFTEAGGLAANRVVRWNGSSWASLGTGSGNGGVFALAASGGNLYIGGNFGQAGGQVSVGIAQWVLPIYAIFANGFEGN